MKRWKKYRREGIKIKLGVVYDQSKLLSMLSQKLSKYISIALIKKSHLKVH